jgi:hypothetical protein
MFIMLFVISAGLAPFTHYEFAGTTIREQSQPNPRFCRRRRRRRHGEQLNLHIILRV